MPVDISTFAEGRETLAAEQVARDRAYKSNLEKLRQSTVSFGLRDGKAHVRVGVDGVVFDLRASRWRYRGQDHLGNAEAFLSWLWLRGPKTCRVPHE